MRTVVMIVRPVSWLADFCMNPKSEEILRLQLVRGETESSAKQANMMRSWRCSCMVTLLRLVG